MKPTAEYSVCDGWPNGDAGGRKLWRLAHSSRRGTLELRTEDTDDKAMNSHGKLVLHPLWNRQPVQTITQQPSEATCFIFERITL